MDKLTNARRRAGVTDRTWTPPETVPGPPDNRYTDTFAEIPTLSRSRRNGGEVGTRWRLTARASIVVRGRNEPSLALLTDESPGDRYTIEAGTTLILSEVYDADADPLGADLVTYIQFFEGWSSWRFVIEDGPSQGIRVDLPSDFGQASRYPLAVQRAALAVQPAGNG